jgi:hypothetical protein
MVELVDAALFNRRKKMIFTIIFTLLVMAFAGAIWKDNDSVMSWFFGILIWCALPFVSYVSHYHDLGIIRAQDIKIAVYEKRVSDLKQTLASITTPSPALLNHDVPVASVTESLTYATTELARVRAKKADAMISVEQRKAGVFGFIVDWFGDA